MGQGDRPFHSPILIRSESFMSRNEGNSRLSIFLKGMAMGAADIVPGVSGGTIAFITGIYERLIRAVSGVDHHLLRSLRKEGVRSAWRHLDGAFLLVLLLGIGASIFSLAQLIGTALEEHPVLVWSFFFGLIAASVPFVGKRVYRWRPGPFLAFIAGAAIAFWITTLPPMGSPQQSYFFIFAGAIAICAMILPGISGSFILLLLGAYQPVIDAIKELKIEILAYVGLGCAAGLLLFSKLLNWMFRNFHDLTVALMSGFLLGSLNKVWPWKIRWELSPPLLFKNPKEVWTLETVAAKGDEGVNSSPFRFAELTGQDPQILFAIAFAVVGAGLIILLERSSYESE